MIWIRIWIGIKMENRIHNIASKTTFYMHWTLPPTRKDVDAEYTYLLSPPYCGEYSMEYMAFTLCFSLLGCTTATK
jgi:hypothetical protein